MEQTKLKDSVWKNISKVTFFVILILLLVIIFFIVGLFIGYAGIGDGHFWEVVNTDTWRHIIDFVQ